MITFTEFKREFQAHMATLVSGQTKLFVADVDKDLLWQTYLEAFPAEVRQEFNCNCCKSYIRNYGALVAIKDNRIVTSWGFLSSDSVYQRVIDALDKLVTEAPVRDVFVIECRNNKLGTNFNRVSPTLIWQHLYFELPGNLTHGTNETNDTLRSHYRSAKEVFKRALDEIPVSATETVLELIAQDSLYRGVEYKPVLEQFLKHQQVYNRLHVLQKDNYAWQQSLVSNVVARIRSTAIGTLLVDIAEGMDLDAAVRRFEFVMAPTNYRRAKPIVTPKMLEQAEQTVVQLGLADSLARRFATSDDITINNVLFANRYTASVTSIFGAVKEELAVNPKSFSKVESVKLADFIEKVLPTATSVELLLENNLSGNLVSLIAPVNPEAAPLFKWTNNFSWSYNNALADSLKEKVKAAGGQVEGELRISLEWYNTDDLDLHLLEPNGNRIYFSNKRSLYSGGQLDVDKNVSAPLIRKPVENIIYPYGGKILEGQYQVVVSQYRQRENIDTGFMVEIECQGETHTFAYNNRLPQSRNVEVAVFSYSKTRGVQITSSIPQSTSVVSKQIWGLHTNRFHRVSMIMNSPNHWESEAGIGNKHVFFMLENAQHEGLVRGFFNEFLKPELLEHKRVFELLGGKMQVQPADNQLSGLGFSTTQKAEFIVRVRGSFERVLRVVV